MTLQQDVLTDIRVDGSAMLVCLFDDISTARQLFSRNIELTRSGLTTEL